MVGDRWAGPRSAPAVAVVLGSGGSAGYAFIVAALDGLEEETGFVLGGADLIVGTSAGALIAGSVAPSPATTSRRVIERLERLDNSREWRPRPGDRLTAAIRRRFGLSVASAATRWSGRPNTIRVPPPPHDPGAVAVSVDVTAGRRACHRLIEAPNSDLVLRASTAVPFFTRPVRIDGHDHLDGALCSVSNADVPGAREADVLIVICPAVPRRGGGLRGVVARAVLRHEVRDRTRRGAATLVVTPGLPAARARRDGKVASSRGRAAVTEIIAAARRDGATGLP